MKEGERGRSEEKIERGWKGMQKAWKVGRKGWKEAVMVWKLLAKGGKWSIEKRAGKGCQVRGKG